MCNQRSGMHAATYDSVVQFLLDSLIFMKFWRLQQFIANQCLSLFDTWQELMPNIFHRKKNIQWLVDFGQLAKF